MTKNNGEASALGRFLETVNYKPNYTAAEVNFAFLAGWKARDKQESK